MHGGRTPSGPAHHAWKHGRYSKFLPAALLSRTRELMEDPDVLSLVPNLFAIDAQLTTIFEQLGDPSRAEAWGKLDVIVAKMEAALKRSDTAAMMQAFIELRAVTRTGASTAELGDQLIRLHEARRRLVATEAARQQGEHNSISYDRAVGIMALLVEVMFRHVTDSKARRRIIDDVRALDLGSGVATELDAELDGSSDDSGDAPPLQLVPRTTDPGPGDD